MEVREFLLRPSRLQKKINSLNLLKATYEELADSTPGVNYDKPFSQSNRSLQAPFVKWIDKIMQVEKKIEEAEAELAKAKADVVAAIEKIPNQDYQNLLVLRYLNGCTWDDICSSLYISKPTGYRWHLDALDKIEVPNEDESS